MVTIASFEMALKKVSFVLSFNYFVFYNQDLKRKHSRQIIRFPFLLISCLLILGSYSTIYLYFIP